MQIKNWKARRSGGAITITGTNAETGEPVRLAGVVAIEPHSVIKRRFFYHVRVVGMAAVMADGAEHSLLL